MQIQKIFTMRQNGKKRPRQSRGRAMVCLLGLGSTYGAGVGAGTAIDASIGVNDVLAVALGDGLHGAARCAGAASDAIIGNLVCHK